MHDADHCRHRWEKARCHAGACRDARRCAHVSKSVTQGEAAALRATTHYHRFTFVGFRVTRRPSSVTACGPNPHRNVLLGRGTAGGRGGSSTVSDIDRAAEDLRAALATTNPSDDIDPATPNNDMAFTADS